MIQGLVTPQNRPTILLTVGWNNTVQQIVAIVDTGFTGDLKVPPITAVELGLATTHAEPVRVADGRTSQMRACLVYVSMEGVIKTVSALVAPGDVILGIGLLKKFGYNLQINFDEKKLLLFKGDSPQSD